MHIYILLIKINIKKFKIMETIIKGSINGRRIKRFMAGITEREIIEDEIIDSRRTGWFDVIDICEKTEEIIKPIEVVKIENEIAEIKVDISYRKTRYIDEGISEDYGC